MATTVGQDHPKHDSLEVEDVELKSATYNPRAHLIPRPSEDEGDPLNWPMKLKLLILFQVCWLAFVSSSLHVREDAWLMLLLSAWNVEYLCDQPSLRSSIRIPSYLRGPSLLPDVRWVLSGVDIRSNECLSSTIAIALNGVGPFIWIPLANVYGRRFVYLFTTLIGFATALGSGFAKSYGALIGVRAINGLFPVSMALGPATVTDLFFYHQRGRALGIFTVMLSSGSHFASLFGGPVTAFVGWR